MIKIIITSEGQDNYEVEYDVLVTIQQIKANSIEILQLDPDCQIQMIDTDNNFTKIDNPDQSLSELKAKDGYTIKFRNKQVFQLKIRKQNDLEELMQQSENEKLNQQILHYVHENGQLEDKIKQLNKKNNELTQTLSQKDSQIMKVIDKLDVLQQLTNSQAKEVNEFTNQISQFEQRQMAQIQDLSRLQEELTFKDDLVSSLTIDIEILKQQNISKAMQIKELIDSKTVIEQQSKQIQALEQLIQVKAQELENYIISNADLQQQINGLQQQIIDKDRQIEEQVTMLRESLQRSRETQQNEIINAQAIEIQSLQEQIKEINLQLATNQQLLIKLSTDKENVFKIIHQFENEQFQLPDQLQQLREELLKLQEQYQKLHLDHEEDVLKFRAQYKEQQLLQSQFNQLLSEKVALEKTLKDYNLQIQEHKEKIYSLEQQLSNNCDKIQQQPINQGEICLPEWNITNTNYDIDCLKQGHDGEKIIKICYTCKDILICKQCVHPIDHVVKPIQEFYQQLQNVQKSLREQWAVTKLSFKEIMGIQECWNMKLQSRQQQLAQQLTSCYNNLNFLNNCQYSQITMQKLIQYVLNQDQVSMYLNQSKQILDLDILKIRNLSFEICTKCQQNFQVQSLEMSINVQEQMKKCSLRCGHDYHADCLRRLLQESPNKVKYQCICGQKILCQGLPPKIFKMIFDNQYYQQLGYIVGNSQYQFNQCSNGQCNFIYIGEESEICVNCSQ